MDNQADFTIVLRAFMNRAQRTPTDLARLTGLSFHTVRNWTDGKVRRPRIVNDVLKLARGLALDAQDATTLLTAAGQPSLHILQVQAQQTSDPELISLLDFWSTAVTAEQGSTIVQPHPPPILAPRYQLRPPVKDFVGRDAEISQLVTILRTSLVEGQGAIISAVQGMGGIGKTELAYTVAYRLRDVFPDAQILLNLRGTSATPLTPAQALQSVIYTFIPEMKLTDNLEMLQRHYQTLLQGQRVLILADDARDAAQVRPLLAPASCALLITSRMRFTLPGMTTIDLEQLPAETASTLLRTICPRLSEAEAQALERMCGSLPLALRVSGGLLRTTPALTVANYLKKLADAQQRLAQLRDPEDRQLDVTASLAFSYAQLDVGVQQLFRQLGVFVADFSTALAVDVVEVAGEADVETLLHVLLRRNLVMYDQERGRWRLHDLIRDLARGELERAGEWEIVMWRYARAAAAVAERLRAQYFAGSDYLLAALTQFDAEQAHIDAAWAWGMIQTMTPEGDHLVLALALATPEISLLRYDTAHERLPRLKSALDAARRLGQHHAEAPLLLYLGRAMLDLGDLNHAVMAYEQALALFQAQGDRSGEGLTLGNLGILYNRVGALQRAIDTYEQALGIFRDLGDVRRQGHTLFTLGFAYAEQGAILVARSYLEQALAYGRTVGDLPVVSLVLHTLIDVTLALGTSPQVVAACTERLVLARELGDQALEGTVLITLGRAHAMLGESADAQAAFERALTIMQARRDRWGEAKCCLHYSLVLISQGERERALPLLRAVVAYEEEIGHAKAAEHAVLLACLEVGEEPPMELLNPVGQRAVGEDLDALFDST
jgi:tetratricopeptide (TPR) repeat protein